MSQTAIVDALLEKLSSGDERAIEEAFRAYEPYLRMIVRRRLAAHERAKFDSADVVQSVWVDLLSGFRKGRWSFEGSAELRAFLVRAVRNRFLNRARRHKAASRREQVVGKTVPPVPAPRPDEHAEAGELWEQMLALCPSAHRPLLQMRRQGLPLAELAARSGMHESSVRRVFYDLARRVAAARKTDQPRD